MADKEEIRQRYRNVLTRVVNRTSQVVELSDFLLKETNWQTAILSKNEPNKLLLEHSVLVAETMLSLHTALEIEVSIDSLVIVGLFHDIGKLGGFIDGKFESRFVESSQGWKYNNKLVEFPLSVRSLYFISRFVPLSEPEVQAICNVEGLYNPLSSFIKYRECLLALLVHWADYYVSHILEKPGQFDYSYRPWFRKGSLDVRS